MIRHLVRVSPRAEGEGESPTLHLSDGEYVSGAIEDPPYTAYRADVLAAPHRERQAFEVSQGWPVLTGISPPAVGEVSINNAHGRYDVLADLSFDQVELEQSLVGASAGGELLAGRATGRAHVGLSTATIRVADPLERLRRPLQREKFLGLGGCVDLPGGSTAYVELGSPLKIGPATAGMDVLDGLEALTVVALVRRRGTGDASEYVLTKGTLASRPFSIDYSSGAFRGRLRSVSATTLTLTSPAIATDIWYWVAIRFGAGQAALHVATIAGAPAFGTSTQVATGALVGPLGTLAQALRIGLGWYGQVCHVRIYSQDIGASRLDKSLGRPLDLNSAADTTGLVIHLPMDDRHGGLTRETVGKRDATLFGKVDWSTTETGRPDLRDLYRPVTLGSPGSCPLVRIDRLDTGDVYDGRWTYIASNGVALVGPWQATLPVGTQRVAATRLIVSPDPVPRGLVPGASVKLTWPAGGGGESVYTVEEVDDRSIRVEEAIADYYSTATVPAAVQGAQWGPFGDRSTILTAAPSGQLHAWIDNPTPASAALEAVLTEHGAMLDPGDVDINFGVRDWPVGVYVGTAAVEALAVAQGIARSVGGDLGADDGRTLVGRLPKLDAEPTAIFPAEAVLELDLVDLGAPPAEVSIDWAPAAVTLREGDAPEAAWQWLVDFAERAARKKPLETGVSLEVWPSAAAAAPVATYLTQEADAAELAAWTRRIALGRLATCSLEGTRASSVQLWDAVTILHPRLGHAAGRSYIVVGRRPLPALRRIHLTLLEPAPEVIE